MNIRHPCNKCLVKPMCKLRCEPFSKWEIFFQNVVIFLSIASLVISIFFIIYLVHAFNVQLAFFVFMVIWGISLLTLLFTDFYTAETPHGGLVLTVIAPLFASAMLIFMLTDHYKEPYFIKKIRR